ncbi:MAG: GIY-YIG nuclease family protein [Candidatus Latescibacterota bacterium]|jgi:putative endonuclease
MPKKKQSRCFWIYILECDDGSYYTGYTNNLARRYRLHVEGKAGVRYTRSHRPVRIAQCWRLFDTVGTALKVEHLVKKRPRAAKTRLVASPDELKSLASAKLDRAIRIVAADPAAVESKSMAMSPEEMRNGHNPFSDVPARDG